jgi:hypothetical protein
VHLLRKRCRLSADRFAFADTGYGCTPLCTSRKRCGLGRAPDPGLRLLLLADTGGGVCSHRCTSRKSADTDGRRCATSGRALHTTHSFGTLRIPVLAVATAGCLCSQSRPVCAATIPPPEGWRCSRVGSHEYESAVGKEGSVSAYSLQCESVVMGNDVQVPKARVPGVVTAVITTDSCAAQAHH